MGNCSFNRERYPGICQRAVTACQGNGRSIMSSEEFWGPPRILWGARCVPCVVGTHTGRGPGGQQLRLSSEATVHSALRSIIEAAQDSRAVPISERVSAFAFYSCDKHMAKSILEKKGCLNHTSWVTAQDKSQGRSSKLEP